MCIRDRSIELSTLETECHTGIITRTTLVLVIELNFTDTFLVVLLQVSEIIFTIGDKIVQRALFINFLLYTSIIYHRIAINILRLLFFRFILFCSR